MSGQILILPSATDEKHQTPNRNHQEQYQTCHNHAKVAANILKWQDSSITGYSHHAASKT